MLKCIESLNRKSSRKYDKGIIVICLFGFAGRCCGYRAMVRIMRRKYHLQCTERMVMMLLQQADPVSVANRRRHRLRRRTYLSRGPNHTWYIDGYDKLAPYGFCISGLVFLTFLSLLSSQTESSRQECIRRKFRL